MTTSLYYYILAILIHVHENGTVNIHIHSSLFFKIFFFASYTFLARADYSCQQFAAGTTENHEHLYHLEHYALRFNFPYRNSGHTLRFHIGDKTFHITAPILLTKTSLKALNFNGHFIIDIHGG